MGPATRAEDADARIAARMNPDLEKLVRLQAADDDLHRAEAELAEIPRARQTLEARLAKERGLLDAANQRLEECQSQRRKSEGDLQDLEARRSKYKGQLMDVKTNKEYTAMLHEIESVERQISGVEDVILAAMERGESLSAEVARERAEFKAIDEEHRRESAALDGREREVEGRTDALRKDRDAIAATLSDAHRELFQRVAGLRGAAVGLAREGMCELCHVKLRPQMFVEIKRNAEIVQCPSCSRILYHEPAGDEATAQS